jgi:hypothetical protein
MSKINLKFNLDDDEQTRVEKLNKLVQILESGQGYNQTLKNVRIGDREFDLVFKFGKLVNVSNGRTIADVTTDS